MTLNSFFDGVDGGDGADPYATNKYHVVIIHKSKECGHYCQSEPRWWCIGSSVILSSCINCISVRYCYVTLHRTLWSDLYSFTPPPPPRRLSNDGLSFSLNASSRGFFRFLLGGTAFFFPSLNAFIYGEPELAVSTVVAHEASLEV